MTAAPRSTPRAGQPRYKRLRDLITLALSLAENREGVTLEEVRDELKISRRTAERMLAALGEALPQLDYRTDEGGRARRWYLPQNALRHILSITTAELAELDFAARRRRDEGAMERAKALESVAMKLRIATTEKSLLRMETDLAALMEAEGIARRPGPRPKLPDGVLETLRHALLACVEIEFTYGADPGSRKQHRARPLGLLQGTRPYLVASVLNTIGDPTLFRLDRMQALRATEIPFERDTAFNLQAFADRSFGVFQETPIIVCLRFNAQVAAEAASFLFHPSQILEEIPDGRLLVRFTAGGRREIFHHLVTWNGDVEILQPRALRQEFAEWLEQMTDHHRRSPARK
jgi:predicted DNA-binding transcriptional regulator YafY